MAEEKKTRERSVQATQGGQARGKAVGPEKGQGYRATAKWLRASPTKVRPVADLIRKKKYSEALALLEHMPHKGAKLIRGVLISAGANALDRNRRLDEDSLLVTEVTVNEGPRLKRIWFRARGRTDMHLHRLCHITCVVDEAGKGK